MDDPQLLSRHEDGDYAIETYEMPQPIPSYLVAFAVGDLASRDLGPRSRVWTEPAILDRAAWEFAGDGELPVLHKEDLVYTAIEMKQRSYK